MYDLFNNTVVCSDGTVKSDRMTSAILIIRLENKVVMALFKVMACICVKDLRENMIHLTVEPVSMK